MVMLTLKFILAFRLNVFSILMLCYLSLGNGPKSMAGKTLGLGSETLGCRPWSKFLPLFL